MAKKKFNFIIVFLIILSLLITGCNQGNKTQEGDTSLRDVKERGKLIVGTSTAYEPMEFYDENGKLVGIDIEIVEEIAKSMGVNVEIIDQTWQELFESAKNKKADIIISSITITTERSQEMLFSIPYFNAGQSIVVMKENKEITGAETLKGKRLIAETGTTGEITALQYVNSSLLTTYLNDPNSTFMYVSVNNLKNDKGDAIILDYVAAISLVKRDSSLMIVDNPLTQEFYGIATNIDNKALMEEINRILREMKRDGKLEEIQKKWVN